MWIKKGERDNVEETTIGQRKGLVRREKCRAVEGGCVGETNVWY